MVIHDFDELLEKLAQALKPGDNCLIMSNGGFNGIHQKLLTKLKK